MCWEPCNPLHKLRHAPRQQRGPTSLPNAVTPPPAGRRSRDYTDGLRRYESQRHTLKGFLAWLRRSVGLMCWCMGLARVGLLHGWGCCAGARAGLVGLVFRRNWLACAIQCSSTKVTAWGDRGVLCGVIFVARNKKRTMHPLGPPVPCRAFHPFPPAGLRHNTLPIHGILVRTQRDWTVLCYANFSAKPTWHASSCSGVALPPPLPRHPSRCKSAPSAPAHQSCSAHHCCTCRPATGSLLSRRPRRRRP